MKRQKSRKFALHNMKKSPFGMTLGAAFIDKFLHEVYTVMNQERTAVGYFTKRK